MSQTDDSAGSSPELPETRQWMPNTSGSPVSDRTNKAIEALLAQEFTVYTHRNFEDAIRYAAGVSAEETLKEYIERIERYGPFKPKHVARWELDQTHELVEERDIQ